MLRSIVVKLKSKLAERKSRRELSKLSDETLKDIGISRGQIKYVSKNLDTHSRG